MRNRSFSFQKREFFLEKCILRFNITPNYLFVYGFVSPKKKRE